ncbi:MAG: BlaI/MecI/CopY family transcriptional regulator [Oscillospiraceae bacterium]
MIEYKLTEAETRFMELIWENEPIGSGELVKLSKDKLCWEKSTTYTELRRLCDKGILCNNNSIVASVFNKDEFYARQSEKFVADTFNGSLPKFVAAFTRNKRLSKQEIDELEKLIKEHKED